MNSLLETFAPTKVFFVPETVRDVFALRLALKLHDSTAVRHYVDLTNSFAEGQLLTAYRRSMHSKVQADLGKQFLAELRRLHGNGHQNGRGILVAIRVERRTIAAAVFEGKHLEFTDARQLSSDNEKAIVSAVAFINWLLEHFPAESAAVEAISLDPEFQRRKLHDAICQVLRQQAVPIWDVGKPELLEAFGQPALKSRQQLRLVATKIWPILMGTRAKLFVQDAAILGLHVQLERQFLIN